MSQEFLVLYDGICGFCNRGVQILLKIDKKQLLKFAPLQGATAASVFQRHPDVPQDYKSFLFVLDHNGPREIVFMRSEGVLQILNRLGGVWRVLSGFRITPLFIRDGLYNWVARHRTQWFGRYEECKLPPNEWKSRFLP